MNIRSRHFATAFTEPFLTVTISIRTTLISPRLDDLTIATRLGYAIDPIAGAVLLTSSVRDKYINLMACLTRRRA